MKRLVKQMITACLLLSIAMLAWPQPAESKAPRIRKVIKKNIKIEARKLLLEMQIENSAGFVERFDSSASGSMIVTQSEDKRLRLWDLRDGRQVARSPELNNIAARLEISPGEDFVYYRLADGRVMRRAINSGLDGEELILPTAQGFKISDDNRIIASFSGNIVRFTDLETMTSVAEFNNKSNVSALDLGQGAEIAIIGYDNGKIHYTERNTGAVLQTIDIGKNNAIQQLVYDQISDRLFILDTAGVLQSYRVDEGLQQSKATQNGLSVSYIEYDKLKGELLVKTSDGRIVAEDRKAASTPLKTLESPKASFKLISGKELMLHNDSQNALILTNFRSDESTDLSLISTNKGWATLDSDGYYDGSNTAFDDMSWAADAIAFPIENFTEEFYRSDLLAETFELDLETGELVGHEKTMKEGVLSPPLVKDIKVSEKRGQIEAVVTVEDTGGGIRNLRVRQNGMLVAPHFQQAEDSDDESKLTVKYVFPAVRGKNIISANASSTENIFGNLISKTIESKAERTKPDLHILAFGINDYVLDHLDLNYATPDAIGMLDVLKNKAAGVYGNVNVTALMNQEATRDRIIAAVKDLEKTRPEDTVLIYYAGHGAVFDGSYYLLPHDYDNVDWGSRKRTSVPIDRLSELFLNIGARRMMVLLDACKSGSIVRHLDGRLGRTSLRKFGVKLGVHVVAATTQKQLAAELHSLGHGVFTYSALQALGGSAEFENNDNFVTTSELSNWLDQQVPALGLKYANHKQYPMVLSSGFDFTLTRVESTGN